ncbi:DUF2061 domain-containing protein [bacterium]|nr:DUF2061 domain-containing protein [bacterium]
MSRVNKLKAEKRHIAKAITWRITGTIDTIILSWILTGDPWVGLKIGIAEVITKMTLYYFHERVWFNIDFPNTQRRHIFKTITWRLVGTMDTMFVAYIISGDTTASVQIGFAEVITKMLLYYFHERIWHKSKFGLENSND